MIGSGQDMIWLQGTDGSDIPTPSATFTKARAYINELVQSMVDGGVPHEYIYCPVSFTSNVVMPRKLFVSPGIAEIFKDAGYHEKQVPAAAMDKQNSEEFRKALLSGSNFSTKWQ